MRGITGLCLRRCICILLSKSHQREWKGEKTLALGELWKCLRSNLEVLWIYSGSLLRWTGEIGAFLSII